MRWGTGPCGHGEGGEKRCTCFYECPKYTANVGVMSIKISDILVNIAINTAESIIKRDNLSTLPRTTVSATGVLV